MTAMFETQLEAVIKEYEEAFARSKYSDASDVLTEVVMSDLQTRGLAAIERASGRNSIYFERATAIFEGSGNQWQHLAGQFGVAKSLLSDVRSGYLNSLEEIIHGEVFGDFLEMADHLVCLRL